MKLADRFWSCIAEVLATPTMRRLIWNYAKKRPFWHITGIDGDVYMERYWLMPKWMLRWHGADPNHGSYDPADGHYAPRWMWLPKWRLHNILRPDEDRALHDHPSDFRSLIIDGWYSEQDIFGSSNIRMAGDSYKARAERFHRISEVSPDGVVTIFWMGPKRQKWGFLIEDRKIPYDVYHQSPYHQRETAQERQAHE